MTASELSEGAIAHLLAVGISHRTAALEERERLAIPPRDLPAALRALRTNVGIDEAVILSTCNRVEGYLASSRPSAAFQGLMDFLASRSGLVPETLCSSTYRLSNGDAVRHLFRVAAGLDSMVLGESEIAAQVKHAYLTAHAQAATGPALNRLFQKALHVAKEVRLRTGIGDGQASIGSVVVKLTRDLFRKRFSQCEVLLWGAGKAAEVTARHLIKAGVGQLWIVNRTQLKARDLASLCQSGWLSWEQALKHLAHVDIAIVCTQAPHYVIDRADLDAVMPQRGSRPLFVVDLAVPRNIDPMLTRHPAVHLYDIDALQSIAHEACAQRQQELSHCEAIIQRHAEHFLRWWNVTVPKEAVPCRSDESFSSV